MDKEALMQIQRACTDKVCMQREVYSWRHGVHTWRQSTHMNMEVHADVEV